MRFHPKGLLVAATAVFVWASTGDGVVNALAHNMIFVASVYKNLSMPQFSATLLGLMGISSGTYLGFKVPETKATDIAPEPTLK